MLHLLFVKKRDVKGHYKKAKSGEIKNFTGLGDLFEAPKKSSIHLKTSECGINSCLKEIIDYLSKNRYI